MMWKIWKVNKEISTYNYNLLLRVGAGLDLELIASLALCKVDMFELNDIGHSSTHPKHKQTYQKEVLIVEHFKELAKIVKS